MSVVLIQEGPRKEFEEVDMATHFEPTYGAENLLTRRATMVAARDASPYNQMFPNNGGKTRQPTVSSGYELQTRF
jgi:hypothetical protein